MGDFGHYNAELEFLRGQHYRSLIDSSPFSGADAIDGGPGDDVLIGQEGSDIIKGGPGNDDIYGGHNVPYGSDEGDLLYGGVGHDAMLGDNGEILRVVIGQENSMPWRTGLSWQMYPSPFNDDVLRDIRPYDNIDESFGNDSIFGEAGNDILRGQRGNDRKL